MNSNNIIYNGSFYSQQTNDLLIQQITFNKVVEVHKSKNIEHLKKVII